MLVLAVSIHHVEDVVTFVLLHAVVSHVIYDVFGIGRSSIATNASHSPKGFRRHQVALESDVLFLDHFLCLNGGTEDEQGYHE